MAKSKRLLLAEPTEAQFTRSVVQLLQLRGWRVAHYPDSRRLQGDKGLPDILAVSGKRGRILALELKVGYRQPTDDQRRWMDDLSAAGCVCAVLRPQDWRQLERLARGEGEGG